MINLLASGAQVVALCITLWVICFILFILTVAIVVTAVVFAVRAIVSVIKKRKLKKAAMRTGNNAVE